MNSSIKRSCKYPRVAQNSVCVRTHVAVCDVYVQISVWLYKVFKALMSCLITHKLYNGDQLCVCVLTKLHCNSLEKPFEVTC